jgi:hypothetical protein
MTIKRLTLFVYAALLLVLSMQVRANEAAGPNPSYDWRQT